MSNNIKKNNRVDYNNRNPYNQSNNVNSNPISYEQYYNNDYNQKEPDDKKENKNFINKKMIIIIGGSVLALIIIIIVLIKIIQGTGRIDETKGLAFVEDAKSYIGEAKQLGENENLDSTKKYRPDCSNDSQVMYITLSDLNLKDNLESPFGKKYQFASSFIMVQSIINNDKSCTYDYYIYLTDGTYSLGTVNSPLKENQIVKDKIHK